MAQNWEVNFLGDTAGKPRKEPEGKPVGTGSVLLQDPAHVHSVLLLSDQ